MDVALTGERLAGPVAPEAEQTNKRCLFFVFFTPLSILPKESCTKPESLNGSQAAQPGPGG